MNGGIVIEIVTFVLGVVFLAGLIYWAVTRE